MRARGPVQDGDARRLLSVQIALVATAAVAWWATRGNEAAVAALFGGAAALLHAWMLRRRVALASRAAREAPGSETTVLYIGAIQRFATVFALFAIGLGGLRLLPVPLLVTFAVAQAAYMVAGGIVRVRSDRQVENC